MMHETRENKISKLIDNCAKKIEGISLEEIEMIKQFYYKDNRSYEEIEKKIISLSEKLLLASNMVNKEIDQDILDKSIIIIGPMGAGKSSVGYLLSKRLSIPRISLDDRKGLSYLYEQQKNFDNLKEFEFFLTGTVLTNLSEPHVIDFGAGHSVYENKIMFNKMKQLISRFSNVILLMPCEDKEESLAIMNKRKGIEKGSRREFSNKHFINIPCNYELSTITEYTKDKTVEEIVDEIIEKISSKDLGENYERKK